MANDQTTNELKELEREFFAAVMKRDRATVERIAATDFIATGLTGKSVNLSQYIEIHFSDEHRFGKFEPVNEFVHLYDDTAVLNGQINILDEKSGRGEDHHRYTTTWIKQNGSRRLAAYQETPIKF